MDSGFGLSMVIKDLFWWLSFNNSSNLIRRSFAMTSSGEKCHPAFMMLLFDFSENVSEKSSITRNSLSTKLLLFNIGGDYFSTGNFDSIFLHLLQIFLPKATFEGCIFGSGFSNPSEISFTLNGMITKWITAILMSAITIRICAG